MDDTIPALLFSRVDAGADDVAFHFLRQGAWQTRRWHESLDEIAATAQILAGLGVGKGTPVAIVAETRPEWTMLDLAILCLGGITVGIYPSLLADGVAWQLTHAKVQVAIVEDAKQAAKIAGLKTPDLRHVLCIDPVDGLTSVCERIGTPDLGFLRAQASAVASTDVATYIYTSGTTGNPKAAVLTHGNFCAVALASQVIAPLKPGDRSILFLPLAHSLQRFTLYRGLLERGAMAWYSSVQDLPATMEIARPTVLASVPRMLEKIRDKAVATARARGPVATRIFAWAMAVGRERALAMEADPAGRRQLPIVLRGKLAIADRLVFTRIRARMGGSLRVLVCGGAALDPEVARFYLGLGVRVLEGWGLTETSAPATANREDDFVLGTVGKALPGVDIRLDVDGEILVRGPGIFTGYLDDPEATALALEDGWFRTGDIGTLDDRGFLRITDRKKAIIVTAGGKKIPPVNLEQRIERSPYVEKAVAIGGDAHGYLVALLSPDVDALSAFAKQHGWPDESLQARLGRPEVCALFDAAMADANRDFASYESIKRWAVLPATFSVDGGELTPTLKLKRRVLKDKYADVIAGLYA